MRRPIILIGFLILLGAALPASGGTRSLLIERFDSDITVNPDGTTDVRETIQARFTGRWNGLFRTIPVEYRTPQGMNYTLFLTLLDVADDAGRALRYKTSRERHLRKITVWIPGAQDAVRTIVLRYRVQNALRFFAEHDELYWNVTGDEWPIPILAAAAQIRLPSGVSGLRAVAFTGVYGSREQTADVHVSASEVAVRTTRRLDFREGLTVAVGWDPGPVHRPGVIAQAGFFLRSNWVFGAPLAIFALMLWLWLSRGRDPRLRPVTARYEPPEGLTPAELGTLLDNTPDMRDITATLVDLAVRRYLTIEDKEEPRLLGLLSKTEYVFHLARPPAEWDGLAPHEQTLLEALFGGGGVRPSVESSDLEQRFYVFLAEIRNRIFSGLIRRGYYARRPDAIRTVFMAIGLIGGAALGVALVFISARLGQSYGSAVLAGILSAASIVGFGWVMPARTLRGARALEGVLGFEEFLSRVEGDRLRRIAKTPEMFEKFLPYAMAFGVEKSWARAFEPIYRQPPTWYRGRDPAGFHTRSFVSSLHDMTARTGQAMASSPRSSGGSGFGGGSSGGSSGGGMGGGGGGGF